MKTRKKLLAIVLVVMSGMSLFLSQCKKDTETVYVDKEHIVYVDPNDTGVVVLGPASATIDMVNDVDTPYGHWTLDKVHCNVNWESEYYDFSATMLTGRFNMFGLSNNNNSFVFNESNLGATSINFWVQLSTFNTGETGRDGYGKCGTTYLGVFYTDSTKTVVDPLSDTAWFHVTSVTLDHNRKYKMMGTMTMNHYRPVNGHTDMEPITKPVEVLLAYNGMKYFAPTGTATVGKLRAGFTATFSFNRSDFVDPNSTKPYWPKPTSNEAVTNGTTAATNTTYGVWSTSTSDKMDITVNAVFTKNYVQ